MASALLSVLMHTKGKLLPRQQAVELLHIETLLQNEKSVNDADLQMGNVPSDPDTAVSVRSTAFGGKEIHLQMSWQPP